MLHHVTARKFDVVAFMARVDSGLVESDLELAEGLQAMVDDGILWHVRLRFQQLAIAFAREGLVRLTPALAPPADPEPAVV